MSCLTQTLTVIMDASSPLTAMNTPSYGRCRAQADPVVSFTSDGLLAAPDFNFKDISMKKSSGDYFSMKPLRGSSPTATLAADLSENFHIDQSKSPSYMPTPRRPLFRNTLFQSIDNSPKLTPPLNPFSSPGGEFSMDISPTLPHKVPFGTLSVHPQSPTPELTPSANSSSLLLSSDATESLPEVPALVLPVEKKRFVHLRPGLSRAKGLSTGTIPQRPSAESQLPPFRFGTGVSKQTALSSSSLAEAFMDSPPSNKSSPGSLPVIAPPRFKSVFGAAPNIRGGCGSPLSNHSRKSSAPITRPRKLARRSHSMYEHPEEIHQQDEIPPPPTQPLTRIDDVADCHILQLPHFDSDQGDLPRISGQTMIDVLNGKYSHAHDRVLVVDCRFEYEYEGGHINIAVNFNDKEKLAGHLFDDTSATTTSRSLIVFHCEYSVHRAPLMAKFFRSHDRNVNVDRYPALTYPEAYILDGGYSSFFKQNPSFCYPQQYIEMNAQEHSRACEMGMGKVRQRAKPIRSNTFAFGQLSSPLDSSPIGPRGIYRHTSETFLSPSAMCRAFRNAHESLDQNVRSNGNASFGNSDMDTDVEMGLDSPPPPVKAPIFNRPAFFDRRLNMRGVSSYN